MLTNFNIKDLEISANGRNVRYQGRCLDKCSISGLIREVALCAGHSGCLLWSDIYWDSSTKKELVDYLNEWISKLN